MEPGYFLPQERELHHHIVMAARYAGFLRLPGASAVRTPNSAPGRSGHAAAGLAPQTWTALFAREPAVAMAEVLAFSTTSHRLAFQSELRGDPALALARLHRLAADLRRLRAVFLEHDHPALVAQMEVAGAGAFAPAQTATGPAPAGGILGLLDSLTALDAGALGLAVAQARGASGRGAASAADPVTRVRAARRGLEDAFELLLNVVLVMRPAVRVAFEGRLRCGRIDPALGLLIAQFGLLAETEAEINGFVDRHTDFYYRSVLGLVPRAAFPETLILRLLPSAVPVVIETGARVMGRVAGVAGPLAYRLLDTVRVVPCQIADARTLVYARNTQISRQDQLGYVTAVRASPAGAEGLRPGALLFSTDALVDVALGIDVTSNVLMLAEGRREISVHLVMRPRHRFDLPPEMLAALPGESWPAAVVEKLLIAVTLALRADKAMADAFADTAANAPAVLIAATLAADALTAAPGTASHRALFYQACLHHADTPAKVRAVYGRIVLETLVEGRDWPSGRYRDALLDRIGGNGVVPEAADGSQMPLGEAARRDAEEWFGQAPAEVYQQFLTGGFTVTLSTAGGPIEVQSARAVPNPPGTGPGFRLQMVLEPGVPPIAPGPGEAAPTLRIRMSGAALFCPFSLFEPYALETLRIGVDVSGMRQLAGFSDDGPLDLSKAFLPFGARPRDRAAFLVGARELALKAVTQVGARLVWAGLPRAAGGFADHYRGYGAPFTVPDPVLHIAYLTAEGWRNLGDAPEPMVRQRSGGAGLAATWQVTRAIPGPPVVARTGIGEADFRQRQMIGAGLLQIVLDCPDPVFGHAAYPLVLAQAMKPSLLPFSRRALPQEPYTPQIANICLDYAAEEVIVIDAPAAARPDQRVVQIAPFGAREIYPERSRAGAGLFAPRLANGCRLFRLQGGVLHGEISIAFVMQDSGHQRLSFPPEPVSWHYLTEAGWEPLPKWSVEADSTDGFMRSGVVRLNIPDTAVQRSPEMPGEGIWLALCADERLTAFPRLRQAHINGAVVTRVDVLPGAAAQAVPDTWFLENTRPGLAGIERLSETIGGQPAEAERAFRIRVGEHLRHRKRGITPWDIERLVLDAFPQVWKCKCFPASRSTSTGPVPGSVSVVVVPAAPADATDNPAQRRMFDVLTLRRIEAHLRGLCGPFTTLEVSNASFERLQVRARVVFPASRDEGSLIQTLKLDLSRFLSVWTAAPPLNGFGWTLNVNDVGAFMAGLGYVDSFSGLSVLQLVEEDSQRYRLLDTARATIGAGLRPGHAADDAQMSARSPWALAMPMHEHWIVPARDRIVGAAVATGIGGLAVGETLIIQKEGAL